MELLGPHLNIRRLVDGIYRHRLLFHGYLWKFIEFKLSPNKVCVCLRSLTKLEFSKEMSPLRIVAEDFSKLHLKPEQN